MLGNAVQELKNDARSLSIGIAEKDPNKKNLGRRHATEGKGAVKDLRGTTAPHIEKEKEGERERVRKRKNICIYTYKYIRIFFIYTIIYVYIYKHI